MEWNYSKVTFKVITRFISHDRYCLHSSWGGTRGSAPRNSLILVAVKLAIVYFGPIIKYMVLFGPTLQS